MGSAQFDTPGAHVWTCPAGVVSVTVQCWGPGGDGADGIHIASPVETWIAGGGGGGGAYARKVLSVTPGNNYDLVVGAHGSTTPSSFEADCIADYGRSGGQGSEDGDGNIFLGPGGAGGSASSSTGDTTTSGFSGGSGSFGPGGNGGLSPLGGQPGLGGAYLGSDDLDATAAEAPGSGGGGGGAGPDEFAVFQVGNGSDGANGRVLISWDTTDPSGIQSAEAFGSPTILREGVPSQAPGATWTKLLMSTAGVYVMYPLGGDVWGWWLPLAIYRLMQTGGYREVFASERDDIAPGATWTKFTMGTAGVDVMYPDGGDLAGQYGEQSRFMVGDSSTAEGDGIPSAEAFGRPFISATGSISPSSVDSEEAFGTPTLVPITNVFPAAIASGEAFGALEVIPGPVDVSPSSIASAEAVGTPTILQSFKPRFMVAGRDRTAYLHRETDYSWNLLKGSRGSCSIPFIVEPGDPYTPLPGDLIEIFDPADSRVWAGTVEQVFCRWIGDDGFHVWIVTGVTLESLFDGAFVDKTLFDGVTGSSAFSDLFDAVDQSIVSLGDVDGPDTIEALEVTRVADGFSSIALRCDRVWFVDPADLTLNLISPLDRAAPWVMGHSDIVWESIQWRVSRADFRDTQVIQSPDGSSQTVIALTPNTGLGRRSARLTFTTSNTSAGAIQEATAVLRRFSTLPSQLQVTTDRPGVSIGMLLEIDVDFPLESAGLLNGFWQVIEVEARMLTGMDDVDPVLRRLPDDLSLGHFRYTLHLVNSLALAIFKGDGVTTVFTLPVTPGSISYIRVSPNPELYTTTAGPGPDEVTIEPAMPPGSYGAIGYQGDATPDAGTWLDQWKGMSPVAASAGPAESSGGGGGAQVFIAPLLLRRLTIDDDIADHAIIYHAGAGTRVLAVLRKIITVDLIVRINLNGTELLTVTIDSGTAVDTVLEFSMSARKFTVTIASPGVVTVEGATLADDDTVVLHTTGALPTGLLESTTYYVVNSAGASFELATTPGGASIDTSGVQSGNHWLTSDAIPAPEFADKDVLTADILDSDEQSDRNGVAALGVEWA